ncbi:hypothetical protein APUTEX25_000141 [Auxenochlorella protothecoides]|uniref:Transposase n=1 Tax=Auxenochlorella protothecoides TaxID=3075 RepID=A0A3M7KYE8_AUXPR|nr:hypothetical protein APUTEX25_000141 [Auxenochlorella protothecoides]|eukprot:RMZ55558.1 hypothetical protein APUTEX25_000141 [Auxenochlorella protothecoides]
MLSSGGASLLLSTGCGPVVLSSPSVSGSLDFVTWSGVIPSDGSATGTGSLPCLLLGCGWYSAGHWMTNGYSVSVTLRRQRGPPRPGDPPPRPPDAPKTSGKRTRGGAPLAAPQGRGIADEYYRDCLERLQAGPPPEDAKIHLYVGIDPGRTKMFTTVDEHANVTSCSSKEFHSMSGSKRREKTIAKWHAKAPDYVKELHKCPTHKTASTEVLLSWVAWILPNLRRGLAWHMHGKPSAPPPGMTTIVGVGNWSDQDREGIVRGAPPGPWIKFLRRLRRVCGVVVVDEHRSSKLCCACHTTLHAYRHKRVCNGRCVNKACKVNVVNRDVNGAANMLMLVKRFFAREARPTAFGGPPCSPAPKPPPPSTHTPATNCASLILADVAVQPAQAR